MKLESGYDGGWRVGGTEVGEWVKLKVESG